MVDIIMPTYNRDIFLSDKEHPTLNICKNKIVNKLFIIWNNTGRDVPNSIKDNMNYLNIYDKVEFISFEKNSLNNRFSIYDKLDSECILSIDDDYIITNKALEKCYDVWSNNNDVLVGVVPRYMNQTTYNGYAANAKNNHKYNLILTGCALFDKKFIKMYNNDEDNKKLVDKFFNGEDIVFNYIHRTNSKHKPLYVHDDNIRTWKKIKNNSISDSGNHMQKRFAIFTKMVNKYGNVLIDNDEKIILDK
jgi:hypothetical protein